MDEAADRFEKIYQSMRVNKAAARKHSRLFLSYLQKRFPLPAGTKVILKLQDSKVTYLKHAGGKIRALGKISVCNEKRVATIKVAMKDRSTFGIITTVAHEYRHAMQVLAENRKLSCDNDHQTEVEARRFGVTHRLRYVESCLRW